MDINKIYNTIFPIGFDDNNKYAELTGDKISTVQLIEPSLAVNKFVISKKDHYDKNNYPEKIAFRLPLVSIDNYQIPQINITNFKLSYTSFVPEITLDFVDTQNDMLSTNIIKDGSVVKVYIGGNGDELYYKPIRQDFLITSIRKTGGGDQNYGGFIKYRIYGMLNVPFGFKKGAWCTGASSARQALFNLAIFTGLGFSTNFTKSNTLDVMNWRNTESNSYFDFMQTITKHACYSPNTFFTSFIDQYNTLNFIECHSLLSHGGKKTDIPAMIYNNIPVTDAPKYIDDDKTASNQLNIVDGDKDLMNSQQKLSYYYISNNDYFDGWTNFIEEYKVINNGFSSLNDGYKLHVTYSDSNSGSWGIKNCEFLISPIDNLKRDESSQRIQSIPDEPSQNSYIPLNLAQMSKKDYVNSENFNSITNVESYVSFGEVDTSNMFKQYYFAEANNNYQLKCMQRCGLNVTLQNYNPSITKYSRIWVDIYDKNMFSIEQIKPSKIDEKSTNDEYKNYKKMFNENILKFEDEGVLEVIENSKQKNKSWPRGEYNRALSGWYVVTSIEIYYSPDDNNLKMKLILNRIEYQPIYVNEYTTAKKAIDKYKEENIIENIITQKDDYSYN